MTTTDIAEQLGRSRASLDPHVRDILTQGRTVRSRNRDGEYAIVLTNDPAFTKPLKHIDGVADNHADWTIAVPDFTFRNVAESEPDLDFFAPVLDRSGRRVGTIRVNGSPDGVRTTTRGRVATRVMPFMLVQSGDLFTERETDGQGRAMVFRATVDADANGYVTATTDAGENVFFDLGPDYLVFKLLDV